MRTFTAAILLSSWATLDAKDASRSLLDAENRVDCCEDLADAIANGVTGSLLEAYVTAAATGVCESSTVDHDFLSWST